MTQLLIAHPGHELLLQGWLARTRATVHVLTDGSGHSASPRLSRSAAVLRELGARPGAIFGRLSDREAYAMILERNAALLLSLAEELAAALEAERPAMLVTDAVEGYNPVHDLCRLVAGAAITLAGGAIAQYEYAVVGHPQLPGATIAVDLDDAEYAAKIERARAYGAVLPDAGELLSRYGAAAYRRETFRPVADWTAADAGATPLYEQFGEARVAAGSYARVIRRAEHLRPLAEALRAAVETRTCVS